MASPQVGDFLRGAQKEVRLAAHARADGLLLPCDARMATREAQHLARPANEVARVDGRELRVALR